MGSNLIDINFKMPAWNSKLRAALPDVALTIAAAMQTNRGMLFDREGAYNGHKKWKPLAFREGQILSARGTLRKSIAPLNAKGKPAGEGGIVRISGGVVTIGTNLIYATMMNDGTAKMPGGVLRPVNAKALKIPLPAGKRATSLAKTLRKTAHGEGKEKFIFRKSVKIPARNFNELTPEDAQEIEMTVMNKILEVLSS